MTLILSLFFIFRKRTFVTNNDLSFCALYYISYLFRKKTGKASIRRLQWYPHDTGMFFMLNYQNVVTIWDTNQLQIVEHFKFSTKIHDMHTREIGRNPFIAGAIIIFNHPEHT